MGPEAFRLAAREAREDNMKTLTLQQHNISLPQTGEVLTVHIGGGDVFSRKPHPEYAPPPLACYTGIIEGGDWNSIRIVSEDVVRYPAPLTLGFENMELTGKLMSPIYPEIFRC